MTEAAPATAAHAHAHHEPGFIRKYLFSTDHKMIGKQFLTVSLGMLVLGGLLALIVRWQLAWPGTAVPEPYGGGQHAQALEQRRASEANVRRHG